MKELTDEQIDGILNEHAWEAGVYSRKLARAVITADRALNAPADRDVMRAPEGWKWVPIEPTQAMCQAAQESLSEWPRFPLRVGPAYKAMLAASPTPPASPAPQEVDMRAVCEALGFDPANHHNAAKCPYCRQQGQPTPPAEQPEGQARTGWPEGMLKGDSRELSKALAGNPNARAEVPGSLDHTLEEDFQHFLSCTGAVKDPVERLRMAYEHGNDRGGKA